MNLPKTGRVVIIDDDESEALPLIKTLSQNGISSLFFTEKLEDLPSTPLNSIRVVFLDFELGTEGQQIKTKLSTIKSILSKIISEQNGPYIIIAWTKFKNRVPQIRKVLNDNPPYLILAIDKGECRDSNTGDFDLELITEKIKPEVEKIGMFKVFNIWEELISYSSHQVINDISSLYPLNRNWHKSVSKVFFELARAYSGEQLTPNDISDILNNSLLAFNSVFTDTIERNISGNTWEPSITTIEQNGVIDIKTLAKINTKLHLIDKPPSNPLRPGFIFNITLSSAQKKKMINEFKVPTDEVEKEMFAHSISKRKEEIFNSSGRIDDLGLKSKFRVYKTSLAKQILNKTSSVQIEISPECDFIQSKQRTHRFITGLLWPYRYSKLLRTRADYMYISPVYLIRHIPHQFIFDVRYVTSKPLDRSLRAKVICGVRKEILLEIQSYLTRHINRPGVLFLDHHNS